MAEATTAQAETTLADAVEIYYEARYTDTSNTLTNLDAWASGFVGDDQDEKGRIYRAARNGIINVFQGGPRAAMANALQKWGRSASVNNPHPPGSAEWWIWQRQYWDDVGPFAGASVDKKVTARGWTRGSEPSLSGHKIYRLNVDAYSQARETGRPTAIKFTTAFGPGSTQRGVLVTEDDQGIDFLSYKGLGRSLVLNSIDDRNIAGQVVQNPNLTHSFADEASITSLASWTLSSTSHWVSDDDILFRDLTRSIKTTTDGAYIEQYVNQQLLPHVPYIPVAWVYPVSMDAGDGVVLDWGDQSQAFASLTDSAWNIIVPTRDSKLYPITFDSATVGNRIKLTCDRDVAAGTLYVGAIYWQPMVNFNGTWWAAFTDSTDPTVGVFASITDALSVSGKIQDSICAAFGDDQPEAYLNTSGTNTVSDP